MAAAHKTLPIIAVLGPTASGKSSLALELAREFSGAIVNCDSRQIYRGMDIGTAKPSAQEQSQVDHHLFDLVNPDASFSAGDYKDLAAPTIIRLAQKGKLAILAGGTGFYYSAIAEGLPPTAGDPKVAAKPDVNSANRCGNRPAGPGATAPVEDIPVLFAAAIHSILRRP